MLNRETWSGGGNAEAGCLTKRGGCALHVHFVCVCTKRQGRVALIDFRRSFAAW